MGRIIAIDYGRKRTGIAVTDPLNMFAQPLATVPSHEVIGFLKKYTSQEQVETFVVGDPRTLNNRDSESVVYIKPFIRLLENTFPDITVARMDERFTSRMAFQAMLDAGLRKQQRRDKELIDRLSAVIILQSWLEARNNPLQSNS